MKKVYEKPNFDFEEIVLSEDVAATCWGYAYAWYDGNEDGDYDEPNETINLKDLGLGQHGCQGAAARTALTEYFNKHFPGVAITDKDVATNVSKESIIVTPDPS